MNNITIYLCEDSIDGIFTAIYVAWSSRYGHANVKIEEQSNKHNYSNIELFSEYITVDTDYELALKVSKSIRAKISEESYQMVCRVALSNQVGKADLIYRFLIMGFSVGAEITSHLGNEVVGKIFKINRFVNYEAHHLLGFVRFSEQDSGLLSSVIHPKNNVLSLIAPHFADRLPMERFIIFDEDRNMAVLHMPGKPWIMAELNNYEDSVIGELSYNEDEYRDLWKIFFQHIAIKERINPKLQRNNLPLRFRGDMTEFLNKQ
ncbi:MAG TPA: TIGR03915 family putative DNA repair protein [Mobilitalea sp.]|nr:TIGR03915 family putative DNA repair protein [Mobilitalea sp.]